MKVRKEKISLEQYLHFFNNGKHTSITVNFLNQIISMHGFKKINNVPKKVVTEAIEKLELINLSRSTLRDNEVSSCAFMSLNDIIADLNELNWQDCCTTSIQTLNFSSNHVRSVIPNSDSTGEDSLTGGVASKKVSRKRKKGPKISISGDFGSSSTGLAQIESA